MRRILPEFEHSDERRTLSQLISGNFKQVNRYSCKKGAVLGDHYHQETFEFFIITKGKINITYKQAIMKNQTATSPTQDSASAGDVFVFDPWMIHSIECMEDCEFFTLLTERFDHANPDLHKES